MARTFPDHVPYVAAEGTPEFILQRARFYRAGRTLVWLGFAGALGIVVSHEFTSAFRQVSALAAALLGHAAGLAGLHWAERRLLVVRAARRRGWGWSLAEHGLYGAALVAVALALAPWIRPAGAIDARQLALAAALFLASGAVSRARENAKPGE
jgi:hypothetical protein